MVSALVMVIFLVMVVMFVCCVLSYKFGRMKGRQEGWNDAKASHGGRSPSGSPDPGPGVPESIRE